MVSKYTAKNMPEISKESGKPGAYKETHYASRICFIPQRFQCYAGRPAPGRAKVLLVG